MRTCSLSRCSDLFWDQHYKIIKWPGDSSLETSDNTKLLEYELPEKVEELIEGGKYKNVEQKIKKVREGEREHNVFYKLYHSIHFTKLAIALISCNVFLGELHT